MNSDLNTTRTDLAGISAADKSFGAWSPVKAIAVNEESREVLHLVSTDARDRAGDIVDPGGALLSNFKANPVVLVNHDYTVESIIGKSVMIEAGTDGVVTRTRFLDSHLAQSAFELTKAKIGGWSIGFRPVKSHTIMQGKEDKCKRCATVFAELARGKKPGDRIEDIWGRHFTSWELLEYSSVAIPMNQDIVNNAVQAGLVRAEHVPIFFDGTPDNATTQDTEQPSDDAPDGAKAASVDLSAVRLRLESAVERTRRSLARDYASQRMGEIVKGK